MRIDTHLHFWDWENNYPAPWRNWTLKESLLQRSYLPADLKPHFDACGVGQGVIVEAGRSHELNWWWLTLAADHSYIGAVVAGCALEQPDLAAWFDEYSQSPYFVGVRTAPAGPPTDWLENPATSAGLAELERRDLSLDLLVGYESYPAVAQIAARYPSLRIILDHCANPPFRTDALAAWRAALAPLASYPNLHIKYSSLLLYTYPDSALARLRPVTDFLFETFGVARMMWGSNWPVELLGGSYETAFAVMQACSEPLSSGEQTALFGDNAAKFYRIQPTTA